jgi:hypothetical protein
MTAARKLPAPPPPAEPSRLTLRELFAKAEARIDVEGLTLRDLLLEAEKQVDVEGLIEARNKYGEDIERELADIEARAHPLQRRSQLADLEQIEGLTLRELLLEGEKHIDVEGLIEAGNKYGEDVERELADIEAGVHPLQRRSHAR